MGNEELIALYQQQLRDFELAHTNYQHLAKVICRDIPCGHFSIRIQYNPARMLSTNANTDKATLQARKCFLCPAQMPAEQKGIPYGEHYHLFINPYPIFDPHFTVPANEHTPQLLEKRFGDLLNLAFDFPGYTLFYNGPDCGASAPDHFHFQMIPRNSMPLEEDVNNELLLREIVRQDYYSISVLDNYLRKIILLKASEIGRAHV